MPSQSTPRKRAPKGGHISQMPEPRERVSAVTGKVTSYQVWSPTYYVDGIGTREILGAKTVEQLREKWVQWHLDHQEGTAAHGGDMATLADFGRWFLDDVLATAVAAGERSPWTRINYEGAFVNHICHPKYGCGFLRLGGKGRPDQQLNLENLEGWVRRMKKAGVPVPTMTVAIKVVKAIGKEMARNPSKSGVRVNPARYLAYPEGATETENGVLQYESDPMVTLDLIDASHQALPAHLGALWEVATGLGLRRGEICGLQWSDLEVEDGWVHVRRQIIQAGRGGRTTLGIFDPKGQRRRSRKGRVAPKRVKLTPTVIEALHQQRLAQVEHQLRTAQWGKPDGQRVPGPWVFTEDGCFMRPSQLQHFFERVRKAAGASAAHMTLHKGRHDHASFLAAQGVAPDQISDSMRHADRQTVFKHYLHRVKRDDTTGSAMESFLETARQVRAAKQGAA